MRPTHPAFLWICLASLTLVGEAAADVLPPPPTPELDTETRYGDPITVTGRLVLEPIPAGKRFQGTWLHGEHGERYVLSYRPVEEYFGYADLRVVVTGRPKYQGGDVQQIMADHLEVQSIELAPGVTPPAQVPTELPGPPMVRTGEELAARHGLWVQLVATYDGYDPDEGSEYWGEARVELDGGTMVRAAVSAGKVEGLKKGQRITLVGRVENRRREPTGPLDIPAQDPAPRKAPELEPPALPDWGLTDVRAICAGEVMRCGME